MTSLSTIERGIVQAGLIVIDRMAAVNDGDRWSISPTMAEWRCATRRSCTASTEAEGMFTTTEALAQPLDILCRGISPYWLGNRSPTARVRDPPIALSRLPRAENSIRLERGSWVVGQRGAAFVRAILIPLPAAVCIRTWAFRRDDKFGARVFRKRTCHARARESFGSGP